ncbi:MAG: DNA translocase FtsK 4TM domain-containing protein, partial [Alphaproteobacteria bacterium]
MAARTQTGPGRSVSQGFAQKLAFLPEPVREFLACRALEIAGLVLLASAASLALALASYNSLDVSLNNASGLAPANLLGGFGANLADLWLQSFGLAAGIPILVLVAWGSRLIRHRRMERLGWRVLCAILVICLGAFALQHAPVPGGWPIRAGLGGAFGALTFPPLAKVAGGFAIAPVWLALAALPFVLLLLFVALGLSRAEWCGLGYGAREGARLGAMGAGWSARQGADAARRSAGGMKRLMAAGGVIRKEPRLV